VVVVVVLVIFFMDTDTNNVLYYLRFQSFAVFRFDQ
jgi:hypothetical protein